MYRLNSEGPHKSGAFYRSHFSRDEAHQQISLQHKVYEEQLTHILNSMFPSKEGIKVRLE